MQNEQQWDELANALAHAFEAGELIDPASYTMPTTAEHGFAVQKLLVEKIKGSVIGWKIGATAQAALDMLKLSDPFWGPMVEAAMHEDGASLDAAPGLRGFECEIAFILGHDIPKRVEPYTRSEVEQAVKSAHLAIELVGQRTPIDGPPIGTRAIADYGLHVAFVRGPELVGWNRLDLPTVEAAALVNGEEKARGPATFVMGDPVDALVWLANNGPGLGAEQWVSTGSLTGITPLKAGSTATADFGPLGKVSVALNPSQPELGPEEDLDEESASPR